jgi:hypothetical protein
MPQIVVACFKNNSFWASQMSLNRDGWRSLCFASLSGKAEIPVQMAAPNRGPGNEGALPFVVFAKGGLSSLSRSSPVGLPFRTCEGGPFVLLDLSGAPACQTGL